MSLPWDLRATEGRADRTDDRRMGRFSRGGSKRGGRRCDRQLRIDGPCGAQSSFVAADAITGVEYVLPCNVLWVYRGAPTIVRCWSTYSDESVFVVSLSRGSPCLSAGKHARLVG